MVNKFQIAFVLGLCVVAQSQTTSFTISPSGSGVAPTCYKYYCNDEEKNFPYDTTCQVQKGTTVGEYYVRGCDTGYYCPYVDGLGENCSSYEVIANGSRLPGEYCVTNLNCVPLTSGDVQGSCVNNVCQGQALGATCTNTNQCSGNLYCAGADGSKVCTAVKTRGTQCDSDEECSVYDVCFKPDQNTQGVCAALFSKAPNTNVLTCKDSSYNNLACMYGICYQGDADANGVCLDKLMVNNRSSCTTGLDCITDAKTSGHQMYGTCKCAFNKDGDSYCTLAPGNDEASDFWAAVNAWVAGVQIARCNVGARFNLSCMEAQLDRETYENYSYDIFKKNSHPFIKNAEDCLLEAAFPQYAKDVEKDGDYDDDDDFSNVLNVAVMLLISFFAQFQQGF